ncbi:MAG TPA: hypothetical protein VM537_06650 [Anaerolineae bacterium]|nr:hypothetical protein [Anaerolineae bacterium]
MTSRRIHVYSTERANEIVRRVRIWSDTTREATANGGYVVKVGVANSSGAIDWFGQWNQNTTTLQGSAIFELTGIDELNRPLSRGEGCIVEVSDYGTPGQTYTGISIEWKFGRVGGVTDAAGKRLDSPDYIAPRSVNKPLFSLGKYVEDRNTREAVEPLEQTLNSSGVTEWVLTIPLTAPGDSSASVAPVNVFNQIQCLDYGEDNMNTPIGFLAWTTMLGMDRTVLGLDADKTYRIEIYSWMEVHTALGSGTLIMDSRHLLNGLAPDCTTQAEIFWGGSDRVNAGIVPVSSTTVVTGVTQVAINFQLNVNSDTALAYGSGSYIIKVYEQEVAAGPGPAGPAGPTGPAGPPGAPGSSTFLGLTDTPGSYAGQWKHVPAVNGAEDALEFVANGAGREPMPTGLYNGGEINVIGGTDVQVIAGLGVHTDSYTAPDQSPVQTLITWPTLQEAIAFPSSDLLVWIMMRESGTPGVGEIVQLNQRPTPEQQRDMIYLGFLSWDGTAWKDVSTPIVAGNTAQQFYEMLKDVVPPMHFTTGGSVSEEAAHTLSIDASVIWEPNRNFNVDEKNPNQQPFGPINPLVFRYTTSSQEAVGAPGSTVLSGSYENPLGTVVAIPNPANNSTIQRLWLDQADNFWITYGQNVYPTFDEARASIAADGASSYFDSFFTRNCLLMGFIISTKNSGNWSGESVFLPYVGGQGGGGGGAPLTTFVSLSDTPGSYVGQSGKSVRVNPGETALEFVTPGAGGGFAYNQSATAITLTQTIFDSGLDIWKDSTLTISAAGLDVAKTYEARISFQLVLFPTGAAAILGSLRCVVSGGAAVTRTQQPLARCQAGQFCSAAGEAVHRFTGLTNITFVIQGVTPTGSGTNVATNAGSILLRLYEVT